MRAIRPGVILATLVTVLVGLTTFAGLLVGDIPLPQAAATALDVEALPTATLAQLALQLSGLALALMIVLGIVNLVGVHLARVAGGRTLGSRLTSLTIVITFVVAVTLYALESELTDFLLNDVQVTIESALAALLFFSLVYGGYRMLRGRVTAPRVLFIITVLAVLIASLAPAVAGTEPIAAVVDWLYAVPVNAGARGILLGIALATLVTGVRVLIGQDRSFGE